jgi:tetratricopeptide (TPR) repeat protein
MKAIDKDPRRRYQSADEMGDDLQRFVNDEPIKARRVGPVERFTRWCRHHPAVAGLIAAVLLLMAAGTTVSTWQAVAAMRSRADLAAKHAELAAEQAKVQARFDMAVKAIGKPAEALEAYDKALAIWQKLADANPKVIEFQCDLANLHNNRGRALASQNRFSEAFTAFDASLTISQKAADAKTILPTINLGWSFAFRGWARVRGGQPNEAAADLRRAVELWAKVPALDLEARFERSRVLALLAGLGADAKSGVTAAEAKTFADRSVAALATVVQFGWALPSELREPDFDSVRGERTSGSWLRRWRGRRRRCPRRPRHRGRSSERRSHRQPARCRVWSRVFAHESGNKLDRSALTGSPTVPRNCLPSEARR